MSTKEAPTIIAGLASGIVAVLRTCDVDWPSILPMRSVLSTWFWKAVRAKKNMYGYRTKLKRNMAPPSDRISGNQ